MRKSDDPFKTVGHQHQGAIRALANKGKPWSCCEKGIGPTLAAAFSTGQNVRPMDLIQIGALLQSEDLSHLLGRTPSAIARSGR